MVSVILLDRILVLPQAWTKYESNDCFPDQFSLKTDTEASNLRCRVVQQHGGSDQGQEEEVANTR